MLQRQAPVPRRAVPLRQHALELTPPLEIGAPQFAPEEVTQQIVVAVHRLRWVPLHQPVGQGVALVKIIEHRTGVVASRQTFRELGGELAAAARRQQKLPELGGELFEHLSHE